MEFKDNYDIREPVREELEIKKEKKLPPPPLYKVKEGVFKKKGLFKPREIGKEDVESEKPYLILINKSNMRAKMVGGVREGNLVLKKGKERNENKLIDIDMSKVIQLEYGGFNIPILIGQEDDSSLYPHDVEHDSRRLFLIVEKIYMGVESLKGKGGGIEFGKFTWIILIILAVLVFAANRSGLL